MWAKPLGTLLLLTIGGWLARECTRTVSDRLSVLDAWIELIGSMRWEIESRLTPIDRFFTQADKRILKRLGDGNARSPSDLLPHSLPLLSPNAQAALKRFSESLGDCYRAEQLRRCDECLSALQGERARLAAELPAQRRLCVALPLSAALGIAVLLW